MKHFDVLKSSLMILLFTFGLSAAWGQTAVNFDTDENWTADGTISSYGDHSYDEGSLNLQLTNGLRNTSSAQDGFPGALGTYSIRLQNNSSAQALFTIASGGIGEFSFQVRRWDGSPIPNYTVEYSLNGGTDWISLTNIDGTLLSDSDWKTYGPVAVNASNSNIQIRIKNTGSTERIMIDDFMWTADSGSPTQTVTPSITATGEANGTDTYWNTADVSIETSTPDATIYYTTDGSNPTTSSSSYSTPFTITTTTTVKAMATAAGLDDSEIATKEFTITTPATATIPYSEDFNNTLGDWFSYTNAGVNWLPTADGASVNGYNSQSELVWLISPEFLSVDAGGMLLSFDHISNFTTGNDLEIRYSTNYAGFGDPTVATWTTASTVPSVAGGSVIDLLIAASGNVHIALVYTDVSSPYSQWTISNLSIEVPTTGPSISVSPETVPDFTAEVGGADDTEDVTINGINLEGDITVTLSDDTNFSISATSFTETDGTVNETLTITYSPATAGAHAATVTLSSTNATDIVLDLNGTATISVPEATNATDVNSSGFTANWNAVPGAESYELDVYIMEEGGAATELFISEYIEAAPGNRKAIEIFNGTSETVVLDDIYTIKLATNGNDWSGTSIQLTGSVTSGDVFVLAYGTDGNYPADQTSTSLSFNGDDAVGLFKNDVLIDVFGVQGEDPGTAWTMNGVTDATKDHIITRNSDIGSPNTTWSESEWTVGIEYTNPDGDATAQAALSSHTFDGGSAITYVNGYEALNVGSVTSYEVTGLTPETTYYYIVRAIAAGNETANSNEIEVTTTAIPSGITWTADNEWSNGTGPTIADDVTIEGDLTVNSSNSFEAKSLTVNGSLEIQDGGVVTIDDAVTNNASSADFTIQEGGNLIQNNTNVNSGEITVNKNSQSMVRLDYTMWSSPVAGQQIQAFSPETLPERIYTYDGASGYVQVADPTQDFISGKGYMFRAPNNWDESTPAAYPGSFVGSPNNGAINIAAYAGNYTSIGNPYPSNIDADIIMDVNNGISTFYFWVNTELIDDEYVGNNYATFTELGGTSADEGNTPTGIIAIGQGFIVETSGASVDFDNTMRTSAATDFFKMDDVEKHRFWLNLYNENGNDLNQILIGYMEGATTAADHQIDGKMFGYDGTAIYNLIDETAYSIQGRALPFEITDAVPLGFKATEAGDYTIALGNFDGLFSEGQEIFIKDSANDTIHNLSESDYTFSTEAGEFNARFEIVYEDGIMNVDDLNANSVTVYTHNENIQVKSASSEIKSVQVYDLQGRSIHQNQNVNDLNYSFKAAAKGVLVIKVKTVDGKTTSKKIIIQ